MNSSLRNLALAGVLTVSCRGEPPAAHDGGPPPQDVGVFDGGMDGGADVGVPDAGWTPPRPPRLVWRSPSPLGCDPPRTVAPPADEPAPPTPEVRWVFSPATDPDSVAALTRLGVRELRISSVEFTERPDGGVALIINNTHAYVVTRAGRFEWVGSIRDAELRPLRALTAVDADWLANHTITALDAMYAVEDAPPRTVRNWTNDLGLSESPQEEGQRLPVILDGSGLAFWSAGTDWIVSSCAASAGFGWIVELDIGDLEPAGPRGIDGAAPRMVMTDERQIIVTTGTSDVYVFSDAGDLVTTMLVDGDGSRDPRHLLGYVPDCGTYVIAGTNIELWSSSSERRARWSLLCEGTTGFLCTNYRLVSAGADCGTFVHGGDDADLRALDPDGGERWRAAARFLVSPPMPLADGGVLVVMDTELLRLGPDGSERWRWPLPPELDHVVPSTALLTESGVLYFGAEPTLGAYVVVAVATNAVPGPMAWFDSGANPRRDGRATTPSPL